MVEEDSSILRLAAQIVSGHLSNNGVALDELPKLISAVHHTLVHVREAAAKPPVPDPPWT